MFGEKENNGESELPELSEDYNIQTELNANVSVFMRSIMGELTSPCLSSVLDPQDQYAVGSYLNGEIKVYDPHGGDLMKILRDNTEVSGMPITSVVKFKPLPYSGESQSETVILAGDNGGNITKFDVIRGNIVECIEWTGENENEIYALDYSSDGSQFAAVGYDKMVRVYDDNNTMQLIEELDPFNSGQSGHSNRVFAVKFSKDDPNILISGGWDNNIMIYDIREKGPVN
jgi:COMPASS component SWD3